MSTCDVLAFSSCLVTGGRDAMSVWQYIYSYSAILEATSTFASLLQDVATPITCTQSLIQVD